MNDRKLPLEIERKYLIRIPDFAVLEKQPLYMKIEIEQAYLKEQERTAGMRIRKSTINGKTTYKKTYKKSITYRTRIEIEDDISEQTWKDLLFNIDPDSIPIKKTRHCFLYQGQFFELDIYEFWNDRATLEIELNSEEEEVNLPPFIEVIKEVTDDNRYKNRSLSYHVVEEEL